MYQEEFNETNIVFSYVSRKNFARQLESIQSSLESETKAKNEQVEI